MFMFAILTPHANRSAPMSPKHASHPTGKLYFSDRLLGRGYLQMIHPPCESALPFVTYHIPVPSAPVPWPPGIPGRMFWHLHSLASWQDSPVKRGTAPLTFPSNQILIKWGIVYIGQDFVMPFRSQLWLVISQDEAGRQEVYMFWHCADGIIRFFGPILLDVQHRTVLVRTFIDHNVETS